MELRVRFFTNWVVPLFNGLLRSIVCCKPAEGFEHSITMLEYGTLGSGKINGAGAHRTREHNI